MNGLISDDYAALPAQAVCEVHHPIVFLLDNSYSVRGAPLKHMIKAMNECISELKADEEASRDVEICVISFNDRVEIVSDWRPVKEYHIIEFGAAGAGTNLTTALQAGIDKLGERGRYYVDQGIACHIPYLILVTDGYGDDVSEIARTILELETKKQIRLFVFALPGFNEETVRILRPDSARVFLIDDQGLFKGVRFNIWFYPHSPGVLPSDNSQIPIPDGTINPPDVQAWFDGTEDDWSNC